MLDRHTVECIVEESRNCRPHAYSIVEVDYSSTLEYTVYSIESIIVIEAQYG